jgi:uncharacterized protein (TIGR02646 family)
MLNNEQFGLCCYCEIVLSTEGSHIEHLKPRSHFQQEIFSYNNLLLSCNHNDSCGHKKGGWHKESMVTPLDEDCHSRLTYAFNGKVIPTDETDFIAEETILNLGLNCPRLKDRRKSIICAIESTGSSGPDLNYLTQMIEEQKKGRDSWPFGFYTLLLFVRQLYS